MLYTPHFLTGAVVIKYVTNPVLGLPLAFLSHIILDMMPHNDFGLKPGITLSGFWKMEKRRRNLILTVLISDYIFSGIAFIWLWIAFKNIWLNLGGIAGVFPDAIEQLLMFFGMALPGWQDKLQFRVAAKYGFIYYPIVSGAAIYLLLK